MKKLELKVLRDLGVAAVVQISDRIHVTSKENMAYKLAAANDQSAGNGAKPDTGEDGEKDE